MPELAEQVEEELTEEEKRERFLKVTIREIACKITCVVVTHPLQVSLVDISLKTISSILYFRSLPIERWQSLLVVMVLTLVALPLVFMEAFVKL